MFLPFSLGMASNECPIYHPQSLTRPIPYYVFRLPMRPCFGGGVMVWVFSILLAFEVCAACIAAYNKHEAKVLRYSISSFFWCTLIYLHLIYKAVS